MSLASVTRFDLACGLAVTRSTETGLDPVLFDSLVRGLDRERGVLLSSSFEYPDRYTRWDIGFTAPPVAIELRADVLEVIALNPRGELLLPVLAEHLAMVPEPDGRSARARIERPADCAAEEYRTRSSDLFNRLRALLAGFACGEDRHLGLYGAWGYDLVHQLDPLDRRLGRPADQRDLVLYLPDEILVTDHVAGVTSRHRYSFLSGGRATGDLPGGGAPSEMAPGAEPAVGCDHRPGGYAEAVQLARSRFLTGDMFECVLTQTFFQRCDRAPSDVFLNLRRANPAPYGCLMNLGESEFLVAASPEMFVRVTGRKVETCPISGTIARGTDALADARQIRTLLNSSKDEAELTMCTDVDRNDKSRVCVPGTVRVIGRRQLEMYSRLIHTVDHVTGELAEGYDALDAFLTHAWAVTVTGAPKRVAMQFIEDTEKSTRRWYGGAIGHLGFNGDLNTGLTLRALRLRDGVAEGRVGATLLWDSVPEEEDAETRLKISAMLSAIAGNGGPERVPAAGALRQARPLAERRVLVVDHEDSFVLTLADYFRQLGAETSTRRPDPARRALQTEAFDLVVLSPGPGRPRDFDLERTIRLARDRAVPIFGVCLGLQGLVEHFGGALTLGERPMHGRASAVELLDPATFPDLPRRIEAGRYHSLYVRSDALPEPLVETARTDDGRVMALRHRDEPIAAVQFHPESIMTSEDEVGLRLLAAVCTKLVAGEARPLARTA